MAETTSTSGKAGNDLAAKINLILSEDARPPVENSEYLAVKIAELVDGRLANLDRLYISAVKGRQDFRTALRKARALSTGDTQI